VNTGRDRSDATRGGGVLLGVIGQHRRSRPKIHSLSHETRNSTVLQYQSYTCAQSGQLGTLKYVVRDTVSRPPPALTQKHIHLTVCCMNGEVCWDSFDWKDIDYSSRDACRLPPSRQRMVSCQVRWQARSQHQCNIQASSWEGACQMVSFSSSHYCSRKIKDTHSVLGVDTPSLFLISSAC